MKHLDVISHAELAVFPSKSLEAKWERNDRIENRLDSSVMN